MVLDLLGGCFAALFLISAASLTAYRAAWALLGPRHTLLRFAGLLALGAWLATVGFHALFQLGAFRPRFALPAVGLLALAANRWLGPCSTTTLLGRDARILRTLFPRPLLRLSNAPWFLFAPFVAIRLLRSLVQPAMGWDSIVYHLPRAARFVQEGAFTFDPAPGSWSFYRNVFAGGEVLWSWAFLPFGNDLLVAFAGSLPWLGVGLATWAFARALGLRGKLAAFSGLFALFVPTLQLEVGSAYVEPPACLAVMVALACATRALRSPSRPAPGLLALLAASTGLAFGIKPPVALPAVLALFATLGACARRAGPSAFAKSFGTSAVLALLPALPWMVHAFVDTGAPLSPMPIRLFGIPLGKADPHLLHHLSTETRGAYTLALEWRVLREIFAHPLAGTEGLGVLSALPLALAPLGLLRLARRHLAAAGLLALALGASCAFLYLPSFTPPRLHQSANVSRFVIVPILMAIPLALRGAQGRESVQSALAWILGLSALWYAGFDSLVGAGPLEQRRTAVAGALVLAALLPTWLLFPALGRRRAPLGRALHSVWLLVALSGLLLGLRHDQLRHRYESLRTSFQIHRTPTYWATAAAAVDEPETPHRIAVTAGSSTRAAYWFTYFFMGSQLQNELRYVPVTRDGSIAHFGADSRRQELADRGAWLDGLEARGITHVLAFRPASIELAWMRAARGRFRRIEGDENWGLFAFTPRPR